MLKDSEGVVLNKRARNWDLWRILELPHEATRLSYQRMSSFPSPGKMAERPSLGSASRGFFILCDRVFESRDVLSGDFSLEEDARLSKRAGVFAVEYPTEYGCGRGMESEADC